MQYRNYSALLFFIFFCFRTINGQQTIEISETLVWSGENPLEFEEGFTTNDPSQLPLYMTRIPLRSGGVPNARIVNTEFQELDLDGQFDRIGTHIKIHTSIEWERRKPYCKISMIPIVKSGQSYEKLTRFKLLINIQPQALPVSLRDNTYTSALRDGDIYKIATNETGIHKLTYDFLKNELNVPNLDDIDPRQIKIYGNGGGSLPRKNNDFRYDDLIENAIQISGENDGSFDPSDYILFYGEGSRKRTMDSATSTFGLSNNIYDDRNYYFIKISPGNGLRVTNQNSSANPTFTTDSYDDFIVLEEDSYNLLHDYSGGSGSGYLWFGDRFDLITEKDYDFNIGNIDPSIPIRFHVEMVARRDGGSSRFNITTGGETFQSNSMGPVNTSNVEAVYARRGIISGETSATSNLRLKLEYNSPGGEAWLDFIRLNFRRQLVLGNEQMTFRDLTTIGQGITEFNVNGLGGNALIWDITNPLMPLSQQFSSTGQQASFSVPTDELKEFVAFDTQSDLLSAEAIGSIPNQNLHAIDNVDALLIYHKDFEVAAQQLKEHRENHSGITIAMADIEQVYNEFSSGSLDPIAIRDMAKMIYDRTDDFRYLILMGDGSFDYRDVYEIGVNSRFIPVFETLESLAPIEAFPSDDFFVLLSPEEGEDLDGALDIAVGRLPVKTVFEAQAVVNKIIRYDTAPECLGDWRNNITYLADDEDNNTHINQADGIATTIDTAYENLNINKIYFDAFQQVSSTGGDSYPDAQASINSSIFKGQLVMNYLGHGGPTGWAQERVLLVSDVNSWTNKYKLPLFVTATCSFTSYDDPDGVSAGELVFLNENGGGIGLFTTVRAVYSNANKRLTESTFNTLFEKVGGEYPPMGEILRLAKNNNAQDTTTTNARKFTLIGDPTQHLALPDYGVSTTEINAIPVSSNSLDTLSALQRVTITGMITDTNGNIMSDFNGTVFPTIFDKKKVISTLVNDPDNEDFSGSFPKDFLLQKNIIFKGSASVTNGLFSFTFIVPKDIDYEFGQGRISYYAQDGTSKDATGYYDNIIIGGTASDPIVDDTPPLVEVFMNDEEFHFGGLTNQNPIIYVKLSDDFGINVAGSGIGHDLTAILDDNTQSTIIMNDFYEAEVDDFTKGKAQYPLNNLAPGLHTLRVKGWDIANNSGEGYTEFIVEDDAGVALEHVLNYPNPFTTSTEFQFEHNQAGRNLRVQVDVYTVSGKLVKTIHQEVFADSNRITGINWDGKDDFGDKLARGVYLYKVSIANFAGENLNDTISSEFEKLVILR